MNPCLADASSKHRKFLLRQEARLRAAGNWGDWEHLKENDFARVLGTATGWVREVHTVHRNKVFSVLERLDASGVIHAGVASLSGIRPTWYEMQRIKNELFGTDATGIEIYPPDNDVIDGADMFHLWILPEPLQFGLTRVGL
jgi:hypothetical protein